MKGPRRGRIQASRGVAQPGSASGLGPEGRRFESFRPDHQFLSSLAFACQINARVGAPTPTVLQHGQEAQRPIALIWQANLSVAQLDRASAF